MAEETTLTIVGNLTADPELRFTQSGAQLATFTVASTPRRFNKQSQQFEDGETLFMRCNMWRDPAENVAESLKRGYRVIVTGRLKTRAYEHEGQKRTATEIEVDEIGPSLRYVTATISQRPKREQGQPGQAPPPDQWATQQQQGQPFQEPGPGLRPVQQQAPTQSTGWAGAPPTYDEPPF